MLSLGLSLMRGSAAFTPARLFANDEPGAWFKPGPDACFQNSDGTTLAGDGDPFGYITDFSGNAKHATQPTLASKPTLKQTADGRWYFETDGIDDFLTFSPGLISQPFTFAAGVRYLGTEANGDLYRDGANNAVSFTNVAGGSGEYSTFAGNSLQTTTADNNQEHIRIDTFDGTSSEIRINGGAEIKSGNAGTDALSSSGDVTIMNQPGRAKTQFFEMLWIDRVLTLDEKQALEKYLARKTGVTI